jgi:hypothetical protein
MEKPRAVVHLTTIGDLVEVRINIDVGAPELSIEFAGHDEVAVRWVASTNTARVGEGDEYRGELSTSIPAELLEVIRVRDPSDSTNYEVAERLFLRPPKEGPWVGGPPAQAKQQLLRTKRKDLFEAPLRGADVGGVPHASFAVAMLLDNLYLTSVQRLPGLQVIPMSSSSLGSDEVRVVNDVLGELGFSQRLSEIAWVQDMTRNRPAAVIQASEVLAASPEDAFKIAQSHAYPLLDLLTLRRGAKPRLLCGVVGQALPDGSLGIVGSWIEGRLYTGNLLGGFLSGEDPHSLLAQWRRLQADARPALWLSLYADAVAEERWDYSLFRRFNLLEGIGAELLPWDRIVLDSNAKPFAQPNGDPYTTGHARGKVFELLRGVAVKSQEAESNFTAQPASGARTTLWDEVGPWVAIRNAVAHRGSWERESAGAKRARVEAEIATRAHDGSQAAGTSAVIGGIDRGVQAVLHLALTGAWPPV